MDTSAVPHDRKWELVAAFVFGCVFLILILVIALFKPSPTPFEYTVFRITIALAAAGVGAILPGFLDVQFRNWLRAGGALALFVVVYFFAPAAMPVSEPSLGPEPTTDAKLKAEEWLSFVDQKEFRKAYMRMADSFKAQFPFSQFEELISRERNSLGITRTRQFVSATPFESPPGARKGFYRQYGYTVNFEREPETIYQFVYLVGEAQDWRVNGFYTMVKLASGQFVPYVAK